MSNVNKINVINQLHHFYLVNITGYNEGQANFFSVFKHDDAR